MTWICFDAFLSRFDLILTYVVGILSSEVHQGLIKALSSCGEPLEFVEMADDDDEQMAASGVPSQPCHR